MQFKNWQVLTVCLMKILSPLTQIKMNQLFYFLPLLTPFAFI
jgi:hypothetical protein